MFLEDLIFFYYIPITVPASSDAGMVAVQESFAEKPFSSNGCSKPDGITVPGEEDFTYCCDRHDACYETCNIDKGL